MIADRVVEGMRVALLEVDGIGALAIVFDVAASETVALVVAHPLILKRRRGFIKMQKRKCIGNQHTRRLTLRQEHRVKRHRVALQLQLPT